MAAGYYKSKEVYKQHRNPEHDNQPELVPVRGLYVAGTHVEPLYQDHNVTITSYTSSNLNVVDYVEANTDAELGHTINMLNFESFGGNIDYVQYSKAETTRELGHTLNALNFESFDGNIDFVSYQKAEASAETGHTINTLNFDVFNSNIQVIRYQDLVHDGNEPCITIVGFTSSAISVT